MTKKVTDKLIIEEAKIIFKNFSGKETQFNRAGNRNFCVIIEDEKMASTLSDDGWNVRTMPPRNEGDTATHYIQVNLSYAQNMPPKVVLVTKKNKTYLDEESVMALDYADIINVDLVINPYNWEVNGKTGVKGYAETIYVTIIEDEFADKYADLEGPSDETDLPFDI